MFLLQLSWPGRTVTMPTQLGGAPPCMVCEKRVYYNEQKLFMSRAWHTNCFKCGKQNNIKNIIILCLHLFSDIYLIDSFMGRGVTIRLATIRYISRYTTHDMVHDTIQNQLIYYQWKIWKHCGMCHQYFYIKTVILARNSEFEINKDVHNHPCPKYLLLTNCVCKQNNKIS